MGDPRSLPPGARYRHRASGEVWRVLQAVTPGSAGRATIARESTGEIRSVWPAYVLDETAWERLDV